MRGMLAPFDAVSLNQVPATRLAAMPDELTISLVDRLMHNSKRDSSTTPFTTKG